MAELTYLISTQFDKGGLTAAERAIGGVGQAAQSASRGFDIFAVAAGNVIADVVMQLPAMALEAAGAIVELGADAEETAGLIENSLGAAADGYIANMESIASVTNRSSNELLQSSSSILAMSRSMGFAQEEAAAFTATFANVAVDLGSFFNQDQAQVFEDIQSALAGSSETMQKYGIDVSVTALQNAALNMGLIEQGEELDRVTKAQVLQAEIMRQAADAMGDAERTADSFTNQQRRLESIIADTATEIGKEFTPVLGVMTTDLANLAENVAPSVITFFSELAGTVDDAQVVFGEMRENTSNLINDFETVTGIDVGGIFSDAFTAAAGTASFGQFGLLGAQIEALGVYADSIRDAELPTVELGRATDDYTNSLQNLNELSQEATFAVEEYEDATFNVLDTIDAEALAFEGAKIKAEQHAEALAQNETAARQAADAQRELVRDQVSAFNEGGRLFDGLADAAEDGVTAAEALATSYREAAFEATIAQNGFNEATAELAVNLGLMTEEEADARLEFVETSAALKELTSNVDFLNQSATDQTEAINLLSGGYAETAEDAVRLSERISGELSAALLEGNGLTQEQINLLRELAGDYEIRINASVNGLENLREARELIGETRRANAAAGLDPTIGFEPGIAEELENRGFG